MKKSPNFRFDFEYGASALSREIEFVLSMKKLPMIEFQNMALSLFETAFDSLSLFET